MSFWSRLRRWIGRNEWSSDEDDSEGGSRPIGGTRMDSVEHDRDHDGIPDARDPDGGRGDGVDDADVGDGDSGGDSDGGDSGGDD
jgi:hypothetical protein